MKNCIKLSILSGLVFLLSACILFKPFSQKKVVSNNIHFEEPQYVDKEKTYSSDNAIYIPGKQATYSYQYFNNEGEELCFRVVDSKKNDGSHWEFISCSADDAIRSIKLTVRPGLEPMISVDSTYRQTVVVYNFYTRQEELSYKEFTGVVENSENVWMHPPRYALFKVLQLNPYPYVKRNKRVENWRWSLKIGSYWGDKRWKEFNESLVNEYSYARVKKEYIPFNGIELECEVIQAKSLDSIASLNMYFDSNLGFVKLDYTNVDGSKLSLSMLSFE